ncbi:MAG TPA: tetratricopeptide repeat protein, partial [Myxococcaceae bacterium]|nr:tetratricopeptide repeat protein [Myxococcaceae bacterium]
MPTSHTNTLSPAELAKLEHAFATDPGSHAYKALAHAYLAMSRYMEAMVVCKKGVKAHPQSSEPRLLLARVYAEQGKDKKAIEELNAAVQLFPSDKTVLRTLGALQMRAGEPEAGRASLLKAYQVEPTDEATVAALKEWNVSVPAPAAAAPPSAPAASINGAYAGHQMPAPGYAASAPQAGMSMPQAAPVAAPAYVAAPTPQAPVVQHRPTTNGVGHAPAGVPALQASVPQGVPPGYAPAAPQGIPPGYAAPPPAAHPAPGRASSPSASARPAHPSAPRAQQVRSAARPAVARRPRDEDHHDDDHHAERRGRTATRAPKSGKN